MWPASLRSVVPTVWPVGLFENYCKPLRGGMCHVPCATNRLMAGTIVVPAFGRVEWCHAGPDRTSRSGAIPENAWTHILTDRQTRPANYFSPTHQRKSSFIERSMLKHLNVHSLRFWINPRPTDTPGFPSPTGGGRGGEGERLSTLRLSRLLDVRFDLRSTV